jgi:UDP-GlcNAc:undecaprenyl-phosphate GlcNAc-1-phosphate transferase
MDIQNTQILFFLLLLLSTVINYLILSNYKVISKITGIIDKPDNKRKIHKKNTSLTAAYSLAILFIILLIFNAYMNLFDQNIKKILIISLCFFLIGLLDDKFDLNPLNKILLLSLTLFFGLENNSLLVINKIFFNKTSSFFFLKDNFIIFTIICVLLLVNAINLSDGINGLAAGIVFFCIFYVYLIFNNSFNIFLIIILINILIIIPSIYKGDQFLGNSGSLFLSGFLSLIIIYYVNLYWLENINKNNWAFDIKIGAENIFIILMIPGIDMLKLFILRILKKKNPLKGDNEHLHHYLIKIYGLNRTLVFYFLLMNVPILLSLYSNLPKYLIIIITILVYLIFVFYLEKKKNFKINKDLKLRKIYK